MMRVYTLMQRDLTGSGQLSSNFMILGAGLASLKMIRMVAVLIFCL